MRQFKEFGDERQRGFCVHCGGDTRTRDHIPPKVFLDDPLPDNLPVVPSCQSCNQSSSMDEEYFACIIECTRTGSVDKTAIERSKIRKIIQKKPALATRLKQAIKKEKNKTLFIVETERIKNVILKLARGHTAYELGEPRLEDPSSLAFIPFPSMSEKNRGDFETPPPTLGYPEIGSRAFQRNFVPYLETMGGWITVQPQRYRFLASYSGTTIVRMVISEYLGCEVVWD